MIRRLSLKAAGRMVALAFAVLAVALAGGVVFAAIPGVGDGATGVREQGEASISFDRATNTIEVKGPGATVDLTAIADALRNDSLLARTGPGQWELRVNLRLYELVTLRLHGLAAGGDVDWLKLRSGPGGYVSVESSNGQISIRNTRITSWDAPADTFDVDFLDGSGRAFISAKNRSAQYTGNRMDVIDSEIAYLGFFQETAYGISWKVIAEEDRVNPGVLGKGMTGTITGSKFHHNYFGLYLWGTGDVVARNNEIHDNYFYGFDAHTVTQRTIVEDNYSHDNGGHGIIFADRCAGNVIRHNRVINNKGHGIMLHESSDNNTIVDNEVTGNDDGIPIFESSNNTVTGNTLTDNVTGLRLYGRVRGSDGNTFRANLITGNDSFGVYVYDAATGNTFTGNTMADNRDAGIFLRGVKQNTFIDNIVSGNESGVVIDTAGTRDPSEGNRFQDNIIRDNRQSGIRSFTSESRNSFSGNQFSGNPGGDLEFGGVGGGAESGGGVGTLQLGLLVAIVGVVLVTIGVYAVRRYGKTPGKG